MILMKTKFQPRKAICWPKEWNLNATDKLVLECKNGVFVTRETMLIKALAKILHEDVNASDI
jgi:hypothetical protein